MPHSKTEAFGIRINGRVCVEKLNSEHFASVPIDRFQSRSDSGFTNYLVAKVSVASRRHSINHRLFESPYDLEVLSSYANFYASFWHGAPARRSLLMIKPTREADPLWEAFPGFANPVWQGVEYTDRNSAEAVILMKELQSKPLRFVDGQIVGCGNGYARVLHEICDSRRAVFFPSGNRDLRTGNAGVDTIDIAIPLSVYGDRISRRSLAGIAFNSGFFVWTDEEFSADPTARVPDPIGLAVESGSVLTPPIYNRPALILGDVGARICKLSIADCVIHIDGHDFLGTQALTRVSARAGPLPPIPEGSTRLVVSGTTVVGRVVDEAQAHPPGGGFFLDVPHKAALVILSTTASVDYTIPALGNAWAGSQGSVELIRDGVAVDLTKESRCIDLPDRGGVIGEVPPNHLTPAALLGKGLARTAVGIAGGNNLVVVHAEGTELRSADRRFDSEGAALTDITRILLELGCNDALAFDGGGSAALAARGALLMTPADRFDVRHLPRERVIPGGWLIEMTR